MSTRLWLIIAICVNLNFIAGAQERRDFFDLLSSQNTTGANDSLGSISFPIRLSIQTGFGLLHLEENNESNLRVFVLGIGLLSQTLWMPAPQLYLSIARQRYERSAISAIESRTRRFVSIYPSIKFADLFLFGFGYSTGEEELKLNYRDNSPASTKILSISKWRPYIALDYDLNIHQDWHIASGLYLQDGVVFLALGVSFHFQD